MAEEADAYGDDFEEAGRSAQSLMSLEANVMENNVFAQSTEVEAEAEAEAEAEVESSHTRSTMNDKSEREIMSLSTYTYDDKISSQSINSPAWEKAEPLTTATTPAAMLKETTVAQTDSEVVRGDLEKSLTGSQLISQRPRHSTPSPVQPEERCAHIDAAAVQASLRRADVSEREISK